MRKMDETAILFWPLGIVLSIDIDSCQPIDTYRRLPIPDNITDTSTKIINISIICQLINYVDNL